MRRFCRNLGPWLLAALILTVPASQAADAVKDIKDKIQVIKYAQLGELVKKNKGKVVVVDFWQTT